MSPQTQGFPFQSAPNGVFRSDSVSGTINLNKENNSNTIYRSTNDIVKTGFQPGVTYFFADRNDNWNSITDKWSYDINEHQVATVTNLSPGSYRADYDTDPQNATPKGSLTMAYTPFAGIKEMLFTIDGSGGVSIGAESADLVVNEDSVASIDLDDKIDVQGADYSVTYNGFTVSDYSGVNPSEFVDPTSFNSQTNVLTADLTNGYDYLNQGDQIIGQAAYTITPNDGVTAPVQATVEIKLNGVEDQSTIEQYSTLSGSVNPEVLETSGDVDLTDLDRTDATFVAQNIGLTEGNFTINSDGGWSFNANEDYLLNDLPATGVSTKSISIPFATTDNTTGNIDIDLVGNRPPSANPDVVSLNAGLTTDVDVLSNDSDPDSHDAGVLSIQNLQNSSDPNVFTSNATSITVDTTADKFISLAEGETLVETVDYTIKDSYDATSTSSLTATVLGVNDAPVAVDGFIELNEDSTNFLTVNLLGSDVDNNDELYLTSEDSNYATISDDQLQIIFNTAAFDALAPNQSYADSSSFEISDKLGLSDSGTINIIVNGVNDAPVASGGLIDLDVSSSLDISSLGTDVDGSDLPFAGGTLQTNDGFNGAELEAVYVSGDFAQINSEGGINFNTAYFDDMLPGSDDLTDLVDYTISDGELTDSAEITVTISAPDADGSLITTSLADFDSISSDLHGSIIGINSAAVDVDGSATVQTPVVLNSDSSASVVSGDAKAVADTTSIEGITDSSFAIASDLDMAASVQSTLDSSATSTSGIAVSNSLIGAQQGIELTDVVGSVDSVDAIDVGGIANIAVGSSMSAASSADTVGDGSGNSGSLGVDGSWANTIADAHLGLGSGDLGGNLGIDVASDAGISSSLASVLSAEATADAGVAVSNAALNASTGMEDLQVEVGGLGLISSINQSELASTASSTTDGASAIGFNQQASGILNSDFNFSDVDSVMSAQTLSELDVEASTTTGDAWSSLDSASVGFEGATSSITGAAEITAIASDQGFAESSTVAGQATAQADQSAIGMDGYSINNSSDLQLSALAEVDSSAGSNAVSL